MNINILWYIGIIVFLIVCVGIPYIKGVSQSRNYPANNKYDYVVLNFDKFKVNDVGSSLDGKKIYLVSQERMGF